MGQSLRQPGGVTGGGQPAHPGGHATPGLQIAHQAAEVGQQRLQVGRKGGRIAAGPAEEISGWPWPEHAEPLTGILYFVRTN
jgi:hypothetical protein